MVLLLCFSLLLMDKFLPLYPVRQALGFLTYPFEYAVHLPKVVADAGRVVWGTKQNILKENAELQLNQLNLNAALQKLTALEGENDNLRNLLSLAAHASNETTAAETLSFVSSGTKQLIIINKGSRSGIQEGELVIDEKGVVGQIVEVSLIKSKVLLVSDAASAVPVRNSRTSETAILVGNNSFRHLSLIHLPKTAEVAEGDVLLTSGLGGKYPAGYPVGVVHRVEKPLGEPFIQVDVRPYTKYYRNQFVLVVRDDGRKRLKGKKS